MFNREKGILKKLKQYIFIRKKVIYLLIVLFTITKNVIMKRRTLNELRQTKDSHYVVPNYRKKDPNKAVFEKYIQYMREEHRLSQVSLKNFLLYLDRNNFQITQ